MAGILDRFKESTETTAVDTSKKVRVGIIGTGWIAEAHMLSYMKLAYYAKIDGHAYSKIVFKKSYINFYVKYLSISKNQYY